MAHRGKADSTDETDVPSAHDGDGPTRRGLRPYHPTESSMMRRGVGHNERSEPTP
jgi:hypothetical protein